MKTTTTVRLFSAALLAFVFSLFSVGCVSKTDASGAKAVDWPASSLNIAKVVSPSLQASTKIAARAVVAHNPSRVSEFQLSGAGAAALFDVSAPTAENFKAAILKVFPAMSPLDASDWADVLAGGWASIDQELQQRGITLSVTTLIKDPNYKQTADLLLNAIVAGFNDGIASYQGLNRAPAN